MANTHETEWETETAGEGELESIGEVGESEGILGAIGNVLGGLLGEGELQEEMETGETGEIGETGEGEGILGTIGSVLGGLLGEEEGEVEAVHEGTLESEVGESEGILGAIGNVLGGLLGEGELQEEMETGETGEIGETGEGEGILGTIGSVLGGLLGEEEAESEYETSEQFFGRIARGIGKFVRRAAPILKRVAKVAAPIVGTAIGGPFGAILGKVASSALGEIQAELPEFTHEYEHPELVQEYESEWESEVQQEADHEVAQEIAQHETTQHEALAEMMAEAASHEQQEGEAEAMAGASVVTTLSPSDRRELRVILPHLVRGVAILTRILRRRRITRPAVRAVPTIVRRTVQALKRQAAAGRPITRRVAARAAATQVRRVLGNPAACAAAIARNVKASRTMRRTRPRPIAG